ncbi:MAG: hypothetical protein H6850_01920 [Alphaproteobacteria bacterium]|nr:MAG: hypothetical protein H6850_01920 [Alphaproteobacteria bacterium]
MIYFFYSPTRRLETTVLRSKNSLDEALAGLIEVSQSGDAESANEARNGILGLARSVGTKRFDTALQNYQAFIRSKKTTEETKIPDLSVSDEPNCDD